MVWDMSRWNNRPSCFCRKDHTMSVSEYARDSVNGVSDGVPQHHSTTRYITSTRQQATLQIWRNALSQQDAVLPQYTLSVFGFISIKFNKNTARRTVEWPPSSPNLTTLNSLLWGDMNSSTRSFQKTIEKFSKMVCIRVKKRRHKRAASGTNKITADHHLVQSFWKHLTI